MKDRRKTFKIITILALLVVIVIFNSGNRRGKSDTQNAYEAWFAPIERNAALGHPIEPLPRLTLVAHGDKPGVSQSFIVPQPGAGDSSQILRLLQLVRETDVFSSTPAAAGSSEFTLVVEQGDTRFNASVSRELLQSNVKLGSLFTLLREYASTPPPVTPSPTVEIMELSDVEEDPGQPKE